jgi:hypothetical protein
MAEPRDTGARDTQTGDRRTGDKADRRARREPQCPEPQRPRQRGARHDQGIVKDERGQEHPKDKKRARDNR